MDLDPHSFSHLDADPNPEKEKFEKNNRKNARKLVAVTFFFV